MPGKPQLVPKIQHACKDCRSALIESRPDAPKRIREAPHPGPRCRTHHHRRKLALRAVQRERGLVRRYSVTQAEYDRLHAAQGGKCATCGRWSGYNGNSRRLSVDHNHATGQVRGLICRPCNDLIGRIRDDPEFGYVLAAYLLDPPALKVIGVRLVPER